MGALHVAVISLALGGTGETVLLDFTATWCGPCQQMNPVVGQLAAAGHPIRKVDIDQHRELAARYKVASIPCFVMLVDGREVARKVGPATAGELKQMMALAQRAQKVPGTPPNQNAPSKATIAWLDNVRPYPVSAGSPHASIAGCRAFDWHATRAAAAQAAVTPVAAPAASQIPARQAIQPQTQQPRAEQFVQPARNMPVERTMPQQPARQPERRAQPPRGGQDFVARAMAASVRLKIEDNNGHSWGSGTVVDSYDDEALILTCGHIFRASDGKGKITVDGFGPGAPQGMLGELIHYDLKRDVALLRVGSPRKLPAISIAPPSFRLTEGHQVVSIGCGGGAEPSVQKSHVTSLNKYVGPANVQVAGQPVQGRSGGGLFSPAGYLVGVCYAADPQDNEGLYAALPSVYAVMDEVRLSDVYQPKQNRDVMLADSRPARQPAVDTRRAPPRRQANPGRPGLHNMASLERTIPQGHGPLSSQPARPQPAALPRMPRMGDAPAPGQLAASTGAMPRVTPASLNGQPAVFQAAGPVTLSPSEQATLAELKRRTAYSEVICVIRRLDDPQGKSEVIVLDRASPDFVRQLVDEPSPPGGQLTSFEVHRPMPVRPVSQH